MRRSRDSMARLAVVWFAAVLVGCAEEPRDAMPVEPAVTAQVGVRTLRTLDCPITQENAVRTEIRPEGGMVSVAGHSVYFPPGAVHEPVQVKLTVPVSKGVEVDIEVNGQAHYELARPVLATLSYGRCERAAQGNRSLAVWHVDERSGQLLEEMPSLHDRASRSVSFVTNHFSRFVFVHN